LPELPPSYAVPYRALPDNINPACGLAPSLFVKGAEPDAVKLYRFVKVCALTSDVMANSKSNNINSGIIIASAVLINNP
jgi:hypothetical protein